MRVRVSSLGRGMKLGGGRKESLSVGDGSVCDGQGVIAEDHLSVPAAGKVSRARTETPTSDVSVEIAEELSVKLSRDGLIETADGKGPLSVRANKAEASRVSVCLNAFASDGFQLQVHPTIARSFLSDHVLRLKQSDRGFPVESSVSVLRWRQPNGGDALLPLNVTCWPETSEEGCTVNVEYTLNEKVLGSLQNVRICVPLPTGVSPEVSAIDGSYHYVSDWMG